ncbi:hypothetical protein AFK68_32370 [Hydrocoleum sp. CS-953]|nr:hypothetical protein AFK68_32370 [Hydrocoleum sp. CS-953]
MSDPCVDIDTNKMYLACLAAYERLAYEGIRIFALAFPYDAPPPESFDFPEGKLKRAVPIHFSFLFQSLPNNYRTYAG